jgi:hypothetical protein
VFVAEGVSIFAFVDLLVCFDKADQQANEGCCLLVVCQI